MISKKNTGKDNSGYRNSGDWNSGHRNSGHWNSGDWNSGHWNSGNWNACNRETGFFNTEQLDSIRVFNKPCSLKAWEDAEKPSFIYFDLCEWNDEEGEFKLKTKEYKQAWREAYDSASKEDIELLKALPNFDADVFEELTGIRIDEPKTCEGKVVEIDGVEYVLRKK